MLGSPCSPCCGDGDVCPDYSVLAAAQAVEVEFSWEKTFYQTYDIWGRTAVNWNRVSSTPRQTVALLPSNVPGEFLTVVQYQQNYVAPDGAGAVSQSRVLKVTLESYTDSTAPRVKSRMQLLWIFTQGAVFDYTRFEEIPCRFSGGVYRSPNPLCGRQVEFECDANASPGWWGAMGVGMYKNQISAVCVSGGATVLAAGGNFVLEGRGINLRARNAVVPPSSNCSRNSGYLPEQTPGIVQLSHTWAKTVPPGNPFHDFTGHGGETFTVYAVNAVFGQQKINLLASSLETNWEKVAAQYNNDGPWIDFP